MTQPPLRAAHGRPRLRRAADGVRSRPNPQAGSAAGVVAGFWLGLWHGIIAPVTFVISLFTESVNIYEVHNNGNWCNFRFFLGFGVLLGGGALRSTVAVTAAARRRRQGVPRTVRIRPTARSPVARMCCRGPAPVSERSKRSDPTPRARARHPPARV